MTGRLRAVPSALNAGSARAILVLSLPSARGDPSFVGMSTDVTPMTPAASTSVRAGRDAYLDENGFTVAAYDEPRTQASFFGLDFSIPNTPAHRRAIVLHDLHHVATGYGTDLAGEGEISAWELRAGLRGLVSRAPSRPST